MKILEKKLQTNLKKVQRIFKMFQFVVSLKLLDPSPYMIYGSGSRRANNIRIRLDPDPDPQHYFFITFFFFNSETPSLGIKNFEQNLKDSKE